LRLPRDAGCGSEANFVSMSIADRIRGANTSEQDVATARMLSKPKLTEDISRPQARQIGKHISELVQEAAIVPRVSEDEHEVITRVVPSFAVMSAERRLQVSQAALKLDMRPFSGAANDCVPGAQFRPVAQRRQRDFDTGSQRSCDVVQQLP
jgi:hypothetical protein